MRGDATYCPALRLLEQGSVSGMCDGELLQRFASRRDEVAFAALVALHGPMVLATCRGVLRDPNDAEDAFQATFLALVKKASVLQVDGSLGGWLYRVAFRTALQANKDTSRRRERERLAGEESARRRAIAGASDDLGARLYAEIDRLPDRYRLPLVLCYLEGLTQDVAARRLGLSEGTLRRRLGQARDRLRVQLDRGGASGAADPLDPLVTGRVSAVPIAWSEAAVRIAVSDVAGRSVPVAAAWAAAALKDLLPASLRLVGSLALVVALVGTALGLFDGAIRGNHVGGPFVPDRDPEGARAKTSAGPGWIRPPSFDGPLAPRGRRLYVSGVSYRPETAPEDRWTSLAIDVDRGTARRERSVDARASIWRSTEGAILAWSGIGGADGSLWARGADGQVLRLFDARDPKTSCAGVSCAFSPDGQQVVAATLELREGRRTFETWRMTIDGSARVRLPLRGSEMVADWSPDGEQLLVVSEGDLPQVGPPYPYELFLSSPDGGHTRLVMRGRPIIRPRFSPDGGRIAYFGFDPVDGRPALMIVDANGSESRRVMDLDGSVADQMCWSPDGSRLAVGRLSGPGEVSGPQVSLVEVVNADGTGRRGLGFPFVFTGISELNWR